MQKSGETSMSLNFNLLLHKPLIVVISGPSGAGKDSVVQEMKRRNLPIHFVVTANTRPPRPSEKEGIDYFFVSHERFEEMIANNELIEYSQVYSDYKGVPRAQVEQALQSGKDVVMRLDVQGAEKIRKLYPQALLIFLVPASEEEWKMRLKNRAGQAPADLEVRIQKAQEELLRLPVFDYLVVNPQNQLSQAVDVVEAILKAEHHRTNPRSSNL